jgi:RHS repeat-associated protein
MSHSNPTAGVHRVFMGLLTLLALGLWATSVFAQSTADIYYIHPDHLNTPRVITNTASQVVWRWDNLDPFGANLPNENPGGLGIFTCNLRLPGQYFDRETKLHYNYFRDYDPGAGRYAQSDPVGLRGGVNTYIYADNNPLKYDDFYGLASTPRRGAPPKPPKEPPSGSADKRMRDLLDDVEKGSGQLNNPFAHFICVEALCRRTDSCGRVYFEVVSNWIPSFPSVPELDPACRCTHMMQPRDNDPTGAPPNAFRWRLN